MRFCDVEHIRFLAIDVKRNGISKRHDWQAGCAARRIRCFNETLADVVMCENDGTIFSQSRVRTDMIAMYVRIDDEVDRSAGQFIDRRNEIRRNRRHAVVNQDNVLVADQQGHVRAESVRAFQHVHTRGNLGRLDFCSHVLRERAGCGGQRNKKK